MIYFPDFKTFGADEILLVIASTSLVLLIINYFLQYGAFSAFKATHIEAAPQPVPVSVVICARNEEDNLKAFLPKILAQDHPNFEVVVVNDCSWDNSENVIDELAATDPRLRKTNIKEDAYYKHGKKFAMLVGIKAAANDHIIFTDADCVPASESWLTEMSKGFSGERKIVLGYGAYLKKPGLLNKLIRFDSFIIATQYMSAAIGKRAYMGVGRNLGYTKTLFFEQRGFSKHYHINSGDDDLFVNYAATATNTNICASATSVTYSEPEENFPSWRLQKARHLTTAPLYTSRSKTYIFLNYFSLYFFYAALFSLLFSLTTLISFGIALVLKSTIQLILLRSPSQRLAERDLWAGAPFYELALLFIYPIFHGSKFFYKPERWTS